MKKILYGLILWSISSLWLLLAMPLQKTLLYYQAESFIANSPSESSIAIIKLVKKYNELQVKWLGSKNFKINQQVLKTNPLFANHALIFDTNESNPMLESRVEFIRLHYTTPNSDGMQNVSGLLMLPPTTHPKGIILYFHSTITGKLNAPSLRFEDYRSQALAVVFAANGYIVVAPDYIGLGDNLNVAHPYILYPQMNVTDGKNMLKAATKYLHKNKPKLIQPQSLFVSGYSEGGSYALWFSRIYQENTAFKDELINSNLQLKKVVPIEGAYNLSNVMFPFLLNNQVREINNPFNINTSMWGTLLKPSLLANVMLSFAYYNHQDIKTLLNPGFYHLQCSYLPQISCGQDEMNQFNLDNYMLTSVKNLSMVLKYFLAANFKQADGFVYSFLFNGVGPLLANGASSNAELLKAAAKANILSFKSNIPTTLISLVNDSLVPEQNSSDAYHGMLAAGSTKVKYIKVDNSILKAQSLFGKPVIDHVSFELYALLIALNEFNN